MAANSFLGANSYLKPVDASAARNSFSPAQLKELADYQPLIGDLVTPTQMANKYLKQTYTGDPTAISNRLGEYQFYDKGALGGLSDYFAPRAAANIKGNLAFKPADFEAAQSGLAGIPADQLANLSGVLKGYNPIGSLGGNTYYDKGQLTNALSGYGALPTDTWNKYAGYSSLAGVKPVANLGGQYLFSKDDAAKVGNIAGAEDFIGKINSLIPQTKEEIYQGGPSYFFGTKIGPTPEEQGYKARTITNNAAFVTDDTGRVMYDDYGRPVLKEGYGTPETVEYYKETPIPRLTYDTFMQQYGATPAEGWSDANTKYGMFGSSPWGGMISSMMGGLGFTNPLQKWMQDTSYLPNFSLYGSGSPEDIQRGFNILQRMSPQNIHEFWYLDPATQRGMLEHPGAALQQMKATANPANRDWLSLGAEGGFSSMDAFKWDPEKGLTVDPSKYLTIHDGESWTKPLSILGTALSFTPLAPLGMAMNVASAIGNKNPLGAIASLLPITGIGGALGGAVNEGLGLGLGQVGANALGSGLLGAGMGALGGGGLKGALTGGLMGGLGSYAGSTLGNMLQGSSPFTQIAANAALRGGLGALSAGLKGRNIGQGALGGLTSGAISGVTSPAVRQALLQKLYA